MRQVTLKARRAVAAVAVGLVGLAIAGCAVTTGVDDKVATATLAQARTGIAVMTMSMPGADCQTGSVLLGTATAQGDYERASVVLFGKTRVDPHDIAQTELAAGTYHVLQVGCGARYGNRVHTTTLGRQDGPALFGIGARWQKSWASFSIQPGEIVNVGHLIVSQDLLGLDLAVADLPPRALEAFAKDKPQLSARMVKRSMVAAQVRTPEQIAARCLRLVVLLARVNVDLPIPSECRGKGAGGGHGAGAGTVGTPPARARKPGVDA